MFIAPVSKVDQRIISLDRWNNAVHFCVEKLQQTEFYLLAMKVFAQFSKAGNIHRSFSY
jgi:hypothetical protein